MAGLGDLIVRVGADIAGFEKSMGTVSQRLTAVVKEADTAGRGFEKAGARMSSLGMGLSLALTAPLAAIGVIGVKAFADLDAAMTTSLAIMGNVSKLMREEMTKAAQDVAKTTTHSSAEAAKAYYYLASAGLSATESLKTMPVVAKFAQAGLMDMAQATEFLADAQSALGLRVRDDAVKNMENMIRVSDVLVKASTMANATISQFAAALTNKAAAAFRIVGKEIEEGVAVLAAFSDQGVKGEEAGERLNIVMRDLQRAAIEQKARFKELGVAVYDDAGEMRNMADIIGDLENCLAGMSDEQKKTTLSMMDFQERSVSAILTILGTSKEIRRYEEALRSAGGTTDTVSKKQLESFKSQMILLKHALTEVASEIGKTLVPAILQAVEQLKPLIGTLKETAAGFGKLPGVVKSSILDVVVAIALLGPVILILAKLITSVGVVKSAFLWIPGAAKVMAGAFVATMPVIAFATAGLMALQAAAIAAMIAIAAFQVAKAIEAYAQLRQANQDLQEAQKETLKGFDAIAERLRQRHGTVVLRLPDETDWEYQRRVIQTLREMDTATDKARGSLEALGKAQKEYAETTSKLEEHFNQLGEELKGQELRYKALAEAYAAGRASIDQIVAAQDRLRQAQDRADPTRVIERALKATEDMVKRYDDVSDAITELLSDLNTLGVAINIRWDQPLEDIRSYLAVLKTATEVNNELIESQRELAKTLDAALGAMRKQTVEPIVIDVEKARRNFNALLDLWTKGSAEIGKVLAAGQLLNTMEPPGMQQALKAADAYKQLGLVATAELKRVAEANRKAYEEIAKQQGPGSRDALAAWVLWQDSVIKVMQRMGQKVPEEHQKMLDRMKQQLGLSTKEQVGLWHNMAQQVSTAITDLGRRLAASAFTGFGFGGNKQLREEERSLRESLKQREAEWEAYKSEIAQKITDLERIYAENMVKAEQETANKLREAAGDWATYQNQVAQELAKARQKHAEEMGREVADLQKSLAEREREYADFVRDAARDLAKLRADSAREAARAEEDSYEQMSDAQRDYGRTVEDLNRQIAEALKSGDSERVAELGIALRRAAEDFAELQSDNRRQLQQTLDDNRRALQEQVEESARAQAERAQQLEQERKDTQAQIAEVQEQHRQQLAEEEADLMASLAERQQEYVKYCNAAIAELENLRQEEAKKLAEGTAALRTELAAKQKEWEQYQTDVAARLQEIAEQYMTVGKAVVNVLKTIAETILRVLIEGAFTKLLEWFGILKGDKGLGGMVKDLSSAVKGLTDLAGGFQKASLTAKQFFDAIGEPVTTAAQAGTQIPGMGGLTGASGVSKFLTGYVEPISAAISAITDVLGYFQTRRMEQDIGRIEVTSRGILNQTISIQGTLNQYLPWLELLAEPIWGTYKYTWAMYEMRKAFYGSTGESVTEDAVDALGEMPEVIQSSTTSYRAFSRAIDGTGTAAGTVTDVLADLGTQVVSVTGSLQDWVDQQLALGKTIAGIPGEITQIPGPSAYPMMPAPIAGIPGEIRQIPGPSAYPMMPAPIAGIPGEITRVIQSPAMGTMQRLLAEYARTGAQVDREAAERFALYAEKYYNITGITAELLDSLAADRLARIEASRLQEERPWTVTVNLQGGSARDREFASYVIGEFVRQTKQTGQLI